MKTASYSELSELTGFAYRTIKRRLDGVVVPERRGPNGAHLFNAPKALHAIYGLSTPLSEEGLDPKAERARLDKLRADHQAMVNDEKACNLAPCDVTGKIIADIAINCRQKLLGFPSKLAAILPAENRVDCAKEIDRLVREVLNDLAGYVPTIEQDHAA